MPNLRYSAPFVLIGGAFVIGILLAEQFAPHTWVLLILAAVATGAAAVSARAGHGALGWACALCALVAAGALRFQSLEPPSASDPAPAGDAVLEGVVIDDPAERPDITLLRVQVTRALLDGQPDRIASNALVLIRAPRDPADPSRRWRYGDVLRAEGRVAPPPRIDGFDYRLYLARQGVSLWMPAPQHMLWLRSTPPSRFWQALFNLKDALRVSVRRSVPAPESALLNGILIGDDDLLPASTQRDFRRTGTSHVISISGFNVGVIVGALVMIASRWVHPRRITPLLLVALWLYAIFVGGSASVVRAVAMASVSLIGQLLWRRGFTLNTVCAAASFMLFARPAFVFDVGFQLSVCATLGLVLLSDPLASPGRAWVERHIRNPTARKGIGIAMDSVLLTLAAQLMTLPILVNQYRELSLIALLSNALILPLQPPIMGLGALAAGVGALSTEWGALAALPVYALLRATTALVAWTAPLSWAVVPVAAQSLPTTIAYFAVLGALTAVLRMPASLRRAYLVLARPFAARIALSVVLACATPVGLDAYLNAPDGRLHLRLSGTSAVLTLPNGDRVLLLGAGDIDGLIERPWAMRRPPLALLVVSDLNAATLARGERVLRDVGALQIALPAPAVQTDTVFLGWRALAGQALVVDTVRVAAPQTGVHLMIRAYDADALGNSRLGVSARFDSVRADLFPHSSPPPAAADGWLDWQPHAAGWLSFSSGPPIGFAMHRNESMWPGWLIRSTSRSERGGQMPLKSHNIDLQAVSIARLSVINKRFIINR